MNYQEENPLDQQPKFSDGIPADPELKTILAEWEAPELTGDFDQRVLSAYRHQVQQKSLWRQWLMGSIRLPVPMAAMLGILLCVTTYLATRKATTYSVEPAPAVASKTFVEIPIPLIQEKVVTRVVYVKARTQKTKTNAPPDLFNSPTNHPTVARADMRGFRPVGEIRIVVSREKEER